MKKDITYVERSAIEGVVARSGLPTEEKAGWTLVGPHGTRGPRLYVPKTKRVGRVDAVGMSGGGLVALPADERHGAVTHRLDMTGGEEAILEALARLLADLTHAAPFPRAERAPRAAKGTGAPVDARPPRAPKGKGGDNPSRRLLVAERARALASADRAADALEVERPDLGSLDDDGILTIG